MSHYNNGTSVEELGLQVAKPKHYVSIQDKQLRKQMKKEKEAIERVKARIVENKIREGLDTESSLNCESSAVIFVKASANSDRLNYDQITANS